MRKPDDRTLSQFNYVKVRKEAEKALNKAGAFGVFPTPVAHIMVAAQVEEVHEDVLSESFVEKLRKEVSGAGETLKRAVSKVIGLFDARAGLVFIDRTLPSIKQTFIRLHEAGHGFMPWQRKMYAIVEDSQQSLDPDIADQFDREANVFASEVLFQLDTFATEANDHDFGIFVPVNLAKRYGASLYSAIRQYVHKNPKACAVIVLNTPEIAEGDGFRASLRRVDASPSFIELFGELSLPEYFTPDDKIGAMVPNGKRRATGHRHITICDKNGIDHECVAEAFTNTYQVFVLIIPVKALTSKSIFFAR